MTARQGPEYSRLVKGISFILYTKLRLATALLLITPPILFPQPAQSYSEQHLSAVVRNSLVIPEYKQPEFPDRTKEVAEARARAELEAAQAAAEAARIAEEARQAAIAAQAARTQYRASVSVSGNGYFQCAGYVKDRRPDIPNGWGNAGSWYSSALAAGWATGSEPRAGAVAWLKGGNHVAYVESVHGDGTITVSDVNWNGAGVTYRQTPASEWLYIY